MNYVELLEYFEAMYSVSNCISLNTFKKAKIGDTTKMYANKKVEDTWCNFQDTHNWITERNFVGLPCITDYPIARLGDINNEHARMRNCAILRWDGNKYCTVRIEEEGEVIIASIKAGYLYCGLLYSHYDNYEERIKAENQPISYKYIDAFHKKHLGANYERKEGDPHLYLPSKTALEGFK